MGRYSKEPAGGDFEQPPAGTHVGICFRVIDLGTQHSEFNGEERIASQVLISWELPEETMADGRPFSVSRFYTNSLHEKAALRSDLAAWRGRDFTDKELAGFDLQSIVGKACLVSVVLNNKGKAKVKAVLALPKGTKPPKLVNPAQTFFLDEPWDQTVWDALPKGIRAIIQKSDEYRERLGGGDTRSENEWPHDQDAPAEEADIPF